MGNNGTKTVTIEDLFQSSDLDKVLDGMKFENGVQLLEQLVQQVEGGGLDLEKSIVSYERGMAVLDHLRRVLSRAEAKLQIVKNEEKTSS